MDWEDETFLSMTQSILGIIRILPGIKMGNMIGLYWIVYISGKFIYYIYIYIYIGILQILVFMCLMGYIRYSSKRGTNYQSMEWPRELMKSNIPLFYWVLFNPMYEACIFVLKCEDDHHYIDTSMKCFEGIHILLVIISIIFSLLLVITICPPYDQIIMKQLLKKATILQVISML